MGEDSCPRWHMDSYCGRGIVTYNLAGTEYATDAAWHEKNRRRVSFRRLKLPNSILLAEKMTPPLRQISEKTTFFSSICLQDIVDFWELEHCGTFDV